MSLRPDKETVLKVTEGSELCCRGAPTLSATDKHHEVMTGKTSANRKVYCRKTILPTDALLRFNVDWDISGVPGVSCVVFLKLVIPHVLKSLDLFSAAVCICVVEHVW